MCVCDPSLCALHGGLIASRPWPWHTHASGLQGKVRRHNGSRNWVKSRRVWRGKGRSPRRVRNTPPPKTNSTRRPASRRLVSIRSARVRRATPFQQEAFRLHARATSAQMRKSLFVHVASHHSCGHQISLPNLTKRCRFCFGTM